MLEGRPSAGLLATAAGDTEQLVQTAPQKGSALHLPPSPRPPRRPYLPQPRAAAEGGVRAVERSRLGAALAHRLGGLAPPPLSGAA